MKSTIIQKWEPDNFELETSSIWSFPERGRWATHDPSYRGNWSPYIPRNLLLRYTKAGELVLDQFAGGGTTLIEAKLLNRNIIGVDINTTALKRCYEKTRFDYPNSGRVYIKCGNARNLDFIPDGSIDFICTHPPYSDIVKYSKALEHDLSHLGVKSFLLAMHDVAHESFRVLKEGSFCAILMGDTRKNGHVITMSFEVLKIFESAGFKTKEVIVKEQHNCKATGFWKTNSVKYNFLLLAHEYLFVFRK